MPLGQALSPQVTSKVTFGGNLDATVPSTASKSWRKARRTE